MMNRYIILALIFITYTDRSIGQISNSNEILHALAQQRVKQVAQFIDRFNFDEAMFGSKAQNVASLFNLSDTDLIRNNETYEFIRHVADTCDHTRLSFSDTTWQALAHSSFIYGNVIIPVDIILKVKGKPETGYRWVITNIKSDLFTIPPKNTDANFINPMNHEVGFTELSRALREGQKIGSCIDGSFDSLSVFIFFVQKGFLRFKQINALEFEFKQIQGWIFTIKEYKRLTYNSGWLISSLKRSDLKN